MSIPCVYKKKRRPLRPGQDRTAHEGELAYAHSSEDRAAGKEKVSGKVYGMAKPPGREERSATVYGMGAGPEGSRGPGNGMRWVRQRCPKTFKLTENCFGRDHIDFMSPPQQHYQRDTPRNYLPPMDHPSVGRSDSYGGTLQDDLSSIGAGPSRPRPFHSSIPPSRIDDGFPRPPLMTGAGNDPANSGMWMDTSNERGGPASNPPNAGNDYGFMQSQPRHASESADRSVQSMYRNAAYFPPPEDDPLFRNPTSDERSSHYARFAIGEAEPELGGYNMASESPHSRPSNVSSTPGNTSGLGVLAAASANSSHARPRTLQRMSTEGELTQVAEVPDDEQTLQDKVRERELQARARPGRQSMTLSSVLDHLRRDLSPYAESERTTAERRRRSRSRSAGAGKDQASAAKRMRWDDSHRTATLSPGLSWERSRPHGNDAGRIAARTSVGDIDPSLETGTTDNFDQADWNPVKLGILQAADVQYLFDWLVLASEYGSSAKLITRLTASLAN